MKKSITLWIDDFRLSINHNFSSSYCTISLISLSLISIMSSPICTKGEIHNIKKPFEMYLSQWKTISKLKKQLNHCFHLARDTQKMVYIAYWRSSSTMALALYVMIFSYLRMALMYNPYFDSKRMEQERCVCMFMLSRYVKSKL